MAFHLPADDPLSSSLRPSSSCSAGLSQRESQQTAAKWNPRLAGHCYILRLSKSGHEGISIRGSCYAVEVCSEAIQLALPSARRRPMGRHHSDLSIPAVRQTSASTSDS
ncbi:hypothetical protein ACOMHN_066236 [Nucella lapillus]